MSASYPIVLKQVESTLWRGTNSGSNSVGSVGSSEAVLAVARSCCAVVSAVVSSEDEETSGVGCGASSGVPQEASDSRSSSARNRAVSRFIVIHPFISHLWSVFATETYGEVTHLTILFYVTYVVGILLLGLGGCAIGNWLAALCLYEEFKDTSSLRVLDYIEDYRRSARQNLKPGVLFFFVPGVVVTMVSILISHICL